MTCIVGLVEPSGTVWIGADSAGVAAETGQIVIRRDPKVFHVGPLLIGGTTSFRMLQLLHCNLDVPEYWPDRDSDPWQFMVGKVVPAFRECFKDGGFATVSEGREEGGEFLVGFAGHLYQVGPDYQVGEARCDYAACGGGELLALGSLHTTGRLSDPPLSPDDRLGLALRAAAEHSVYVRGPFLIECQPHSAVQGSAATIAPVLIR